MKQALIAALLLITIGAQAQTITTDTTYFTTVNGQLFQVNRVVYESGAYYESAVTTDTNRVVTVTAAKIRGRADEANKAFQALWQGRSMFAEAIRLDASVNAGVGSSPLRLISDQSGQIFTDTLATWALEVNGNQTPAVFTVNNTGVLRVQVGTQANRVVVLLGSVLRIAALPSTGTNQVLYRLNDRIWTTLDGSYRLVRTSLRQAPETQTGF